MLMLRFALRRFYFALIGLMLLTLPTFAALRVESRQPYCGEPPLHCDYYPGTERPRFSPEGPLDAVWHGGAPPNDYWPMALVLLAAGGAVQIAGLVRSRGRTATLA